MQMQLSIVVPCYNEQENIPLILDRFRAALDGREQIEVLLVNNGSTDGSAAVFSRELARPDHRFARVVDVKVNQGYGCGILSGLKQARGEYLAWTHADLQTDPHDVLLGFERLQREPLPERCLVRGRRMGRPLSDRFFTWGMGRVASAALGERLWDINAQPKIFHRDLFALMQDAPWDFSLDLYLLYLAQRRDWTCVEQPVRFEARQHGVAKGGGTLRGKLRLTRRTLKYIFEFRQRLRSTVPLAAPHFSPRPDTDAGPVSTDSFNSSTRRWQ
jgi:glycosyltransferase involved in cell wall biosynthesis